MPCVRRAKEEEIAEELIGEAEGDGEGGEAEDEVHCGSEPHHLSRALRVDACLTIPPSPNRSWRL